MTDFNNSLLIACQELNRELIQQFGPDAAQQKLIAMLDAIDPALARQLLFHAIAGGLTYTLSCSQWDTDRVRLSKVTVIKAIREATGLGLKEAKELCDLAVEGRAATLPPVDNFNVKRLKDAIALTGFYLK